MNTITRQFGLFPEVEQFRMRRLQIYNWGTFDGLHCIPVAKQGFLFVGRSGSGKTTLLDAISALMVPPRWIDFNAAARDISRRGRDRNWASYVRGAWSEQKDETTGEIAPQFLRTGTTWSALSLTFNGRHGEIVALVGLFWLRGNKTGSGDVRRHFIIFERPFDLEELQDFNLDLRRLKKKLSDGIFFDKFNPYCERFRRLLNIENETALRLLHKTQSAKSLGDLNEFLRNFMLDTPKTFEVANTLVNEFAELNQAHQAVVTAREQVQILVPAREQYTRLQQVLKEMQHLDLLLQGIDAYREQMHMGLLKERIEKLTVQSEGLQGEYKRAEAVVDNYKRQLRDLESQHRELGGDRIERLSSEKNDREADRLRRLGKRNQARCACEWLGLDLPDSAAGFSELLGKARRELEHRQEQAHQYRTKRDELAIELSSVGKSFTETVQEVKSLERQPSNVPARMLELRRKIASQLGISEAALPFVGEQLEVIPEAPKWRGAIERVLHGFALSMLVDERHYPAVSSCVNEMHLGNRLVYYRVSKAKPLGVLPPDMDSLVGKLKIKEGLYKEWLRYELNQRFNYICVNSPRALDKHSRALTCEGLVRHGKTRHEKNDRYRIDNQLRWVLGFDNREKLTLYKKQAQALGDRIAEIEQEIEELQTKEDQRAEHALHCQTLVNLQWEEIDVVPLIERIAAIDKQLDEIRQGNQELQQIQTQIDKANTDLNKADQSLRNINLKLDNVQGEIKSRKVELTKIDQLCIAELSIEQSEGLETRFNALGKKPSIDNLDGQANLVERQLNYDHKRLIGEQNQLIRGIETKFTEFITNWEAESDGLDASIESATDFFSKLKRLEVDGLPRHEKRFFELLREQSHQNLASLNTHLRQARNEIRERMEIVNEGLQQAEFNRGSFLRIDVGDRRLPDVQEFKREIHDALSHAWTEDRKEAENRFMALRGLVKRLADQDPVQRRWRETVLDVRQHVEFIARELDGNGMELEVYRSGAGKSGGQRQKLATTCLAAALRYQLGGTEQDLPVYSPVVLDEAFDKADNEFTSLAMNIFTKFGFQMIIATPLKSVMTLEPFIGGACFVDINERQRSGVLLIEYDDDRRRLNLPEQALDKTTTAVS